MRNGKLSKEEKREKNRPRVAIGIVLTAPIQAGLEGPLAVTGVPAALLTAVMFMLCLTPVGRALELVPAAIWLYMDGSSLRGA